MLKKKYIVPIIIMVIGLCCWSYYSNEESHQAALALSKSAIRFHVLANSDSTEDQQLKMKVKENVVNYIYQNTKSLDTLDETKIFITRNNKAIKSIAQNTVKDYGYNYNVSSSFGPQDFPEKSYGDVVFPKGNYTSYTLSIGKGQGHNWWCVLYPPLCFVDASTAVVPDSSKERLRSSLTTKEYDSVVRYRFKFLTFLNPDN